MWLEKRAHNPIQNGESKDKDKVPTVFQYLLKICNMIFVFIVELRWKTTEFLPITSTNFLTFAGASVARFTILGLRGKGSLINYKRKKNRNFGSSLPVETQPQAWPFEACDGLHAS